MPPIVHVIQFLLTNGGQIGSVMIHMNFGQEPNKLICNQWCWAIFADKWCTNWKCNDPHELWTGTQQVDL